MIGIRKFEDNGYKLFGMIIFKIIIISQIPEVITLGENILYLEHIKLKTNMKKQMKIVKVNIG